MGEASGESGPVSCKHPEADNTTIYQLISDLVRQFLRATRCRSQLCKIAQAQDGDGSQNLEFEARLAQARTGHRLFTKRRGEACRCV